jgi:hypothetical protein
MRLLAYFGISYSYLVYYVGASGSAAIKAFHAFLLAGCAYVGYLSTDDNDNNDNTVLLAIATSAAIVCVGNAATPKIFEPTEGNRLIYVLTYMYDLCIYLY